jgi:sodium transport system permease protein
MNWQNILTVYLKELKDSLRDRRTLISMIVVPTLIMPIIMFGVGTIMTKIVKSARSETVSVMVLGGADSPGVVSALQADKKFRLVPENAGYKQLISDKKVRVAVEIPAGFEAALKGGEAQTVSLYYYEGELKSGFGLKAVQEFFTALREKTVETRLTDRGIPASVIRPFVVRKQNVAPPEKVGGNAIGGFIPYLIIILCFTGAMYPAMDLTAGEKERGTMETLLCSPVRRINIVVGKFLMVLTASLTTVLLSIVSMGVSAAIGVMYFGGQAASAGATPALAGKAAEGGTIPLIDPMGLIGVAALVLPVAVFFAAILLAISLFAKSYKEAQSYVSPLIIVVIMPAVIGMLPGVELNARLALVPILNLSLVCKEMLSGVWHWDYIALIFGSSCLYAAVALGFAVRMFNREDVMFRA